MDSMSYPRWNPFRLSQAQSLPPVVPMPVGPGSPSTTPVIPSSYSFLSTSVIGVIAGAITGAAVGWAFGMKHAEKAAGVGAGAGFVASNLAKIF